MEILAEQPSRVQSPAEAEVSVTERILKLRWLGMQQEAEELHLTLCPVPHTNYVIVVPRETD